MRAINVSTDVFASIWALRDPGEETEDVILRRVLATSGKAVPQALAAEIGFHDPRFGVSFPSGFEIFRSYLGGSFRARAVSGRWTLPDGREANSLNELSRLIGAKTENAWANWFWLDEKGQRRAVSELRDPVRVPSRKGSGGANAERPANQQDITWRDDVLLAMRNLGSNAPLDAIYTQVMRIRTEFGRSTPPSLQAVVRKTLEENSSDSEAFRHGPDLFCMPAGKGAGIWAVRLGQ